MTQAPYSAHVPPPTPAAGRSALLVAAVVMSALALLLAAAGVVIALTAGADAPYDDDDGGQGWGPFRGHVVAPAGALPGADLADAVQQTIRDDGEESSAMSCPDTARVAQNVTSVCHGRIDGDDWAVVVFFESSDGDYTLVPA